MKILRYWAKSNSSSATPWRWSDLSVDDAQQKADARAIELGRLLESGAPLNRYGYGDRFLREEIIQTIRGDSRTDTAIITRNSYGVLVLNAASAMFLDIDFPASSKGGGLLSRLFGGRASGSPEASALKKIEEWAAGHHNLGVKVYRTFAGMRCLVTSRPFDLAHDETIQMLIGSGSDPLYVQLCRAQACFRARLTPKPWRCRVPLPPSRYPWSTDEAESRYRNWQAGYEKSIQSYCTCRLVQEFGPTAVHPEIRPILELHDHHSCEGTDRPLA